MDKYKRIEQCLTSALSGNALTEKIIRQDDGLWNVFLGQELVTIEVSDELQRVNFSIESLEVFNDIPKEKLILLLQYSFVWQATGGVYFSLTGSNQPVMMICTNINEINEPLIRTVIFGLLDKFSIWKEVIQ